MSIINEDWSVEEPSNGYRTDCWAPGAEIAAGKDHLSILGLRASFDEDEEDVDSPEWRAQAAEWINARAKLIALTTRMARALLEVDSMRSDGCHVCGMGAEHQLACSHAALCDELRAIAGAA